MSLDDTPDASLAGKLLIAMPAIGDERFDRAVIYLCAHTSQGAMGIMVNKPLEEPLFEELLKHLDVSPWPPRRVIPLCSGGPVDRERGFVLHTADWTSDASLTVDDGLALTASLDVLHALAQGEGPRAGFLALGYVGWGPSQLDSELSNNVWLSSAADETIVFDQAHQTKWTRALSTLRVDPRQLSSAAGHA